MTAYSLTSDYGSFSLTLESAWAGYGLILDYGSFSLTLGSAVGARPDRALLCDFGDFRAVGRPSSYALNYPMACEVGRLRISQADVALVFARLQVVSDQLGLLATQDISNTVDCLASDAGAVGEAASWVVRYGPSISEAVLARDAPSFGIVVSQMLAEGLSFHEVLFLTLNAAVSEGLRFSSALTVIDSIMVAASLSLSDPIATKFDITLSVAEAMAFNVTFGQFFGVGVSEQAVLSTTLAPLWQFVAASTERLSMADLVGNALLLRLTCSDALELADDEVLRYIMSGRIAEGIQITAGYVSPGGEFTTWAINTRTTGVTEYHDFVFDSMIQLGRKALAADATGLYELNGDTDAGEPIAASILSGFAQFSGSHFSAIKAAYLGMAGSGRFLLKLTTGGGQTYVYEVTARDMRTTRVNMGKGLRSCYFRFELINADGDDFDLDTIEFLPLAAQRRI